MRMVKLTDVPKEVQVKDGKLFFGKHEVQDCSFIKEDEIAALYVVRVKGGYWEFVTGFDLSRGLFWLGGVGIKMWQEQQRMSIPSAYYDSMYSIEYILDKLCDQTAGKEWMFFEEEDFDQQHEIN